MPRLSDQLRLQRAFLFGPVVESFVAGAATLLPESKGCGHGAGHLSLRGNLEESGADVARHAVVTHQPGDVAVELHFGWCRYHLSCLDISKGAVFLDFPPARASYRVAEQVQPVEAFGHACDVGRVREIGGPDSLVEEALQLMVVLEQGIAAGVPQFQFQLFGERGCR